MTRGCDCDENGVVSERVMLIRCGGGCSGLEDSSFHLWWDLRPSLFKQNARDGVAERVQRGEGTCLDRC
jgi:hypothetical protein